MSRRIAVLAGDGIGPEVVDVALERLDPSWERITIEAGAERYLRTGETITRAEIETIAGCDALLLGAVGDPRVPDGVLERGVLLHLRRELDLYVNLRPFPELGIVFVRENTEGLYAGVGESGDVHAFETSVNTRSAIERAARFAFQLALARRGHLTWVHKTNVLTYAGELWRSVVDDVAVSFPDVPVDYQHVDAAAYHLVREPGRFDVVLTDNLFGDILSDLAAGVGAGLGAAASANLHPDPRTRPQRCVGLFEPVHGSAPDIAGTGTADPSAAIGAVELLIDALAQEVPVP
jgi:3-isopropylmalate dehydrogenase